MKYPYIYAYNMLYAPFPAQFFADKEMDIADKFNAPSNAVRVKADGSIVTLEDLSGAFKDDILGYIKEKGIQVN